MAVAVFTLLPVSKDVLDELGQLDLEIVRFPEATIAAALHTAKRYQLGQLEQSGLPGQLEELSIAETVQVTASNQTKEAV